MGFYPLQREGVSYTTVADLLQQSSKAELLCKGKRDLHANQSGNHLSLYKGRGMDYAESRLYQSGDDVRHLDWRVTARTGKPHTKIFSEEREKPILLLVDFRKPMFFGSRKCFKSVLASRIASLLVWKSIKEGDKAGGIILANKPAVFQPSRSSTSVAAFIDALANASQIAGVSDNDAALANSTSLLNNVVSAGTELIIISDFRGFNSSVVDELASLSKKLSLKLIEVTDPLEQDFAQQSDSVRLTDGHKMLKLNIKMQRGYLKTRAIRKQALSNLEQQYRTTTIAISTADSETDILLKLGRGLK